MVEEIKQTEESKKVDEIKQVEELAKVHAKESGYSRVHYIIYFIAGLLEIVLLFRLLFKLTAADATSGFVNFVYSVTDFFVAPYAVFVFEPGTLVAMAVYAVLAWGIAKIISIVVGRPHNVE